MNESHLSSKSVKEPNKLYLGSFMAVISLLGASSIVPFLDYYEDTTFLMRNLYRNEILTIVCIPTTIYIWMKSKNIDYSLIFTRET